jgi:hypothetical protein
MNLIDLTSCTASAPEFAVPRNPIPPIKKGLERNPLPPLKKEQRNTVLAPTVGWYRSAPHKNSPKTSPILLPCRINSIGIQPQNGSTVTTTHVFRPNQRRKAFRLLPIWLRNPGFRGHSYQERASWRPGDPPGGVRGLPSSKRAIPIKPHEIFSANGLPYSARYEKHCPKLNS